MLWARSRAAQSLVLAQTMIRANVEPDVDYEAAPQEWLHWFPPSWPPPVPNHALSPASQEQQNGSMQQNEWEGKKTGRRPLLQAKARSTEL